MVGLIQRDFEIALLSIEKNGTTVAAAFHHFNTRNRARREEGEHSVPVIRRAEAQAEQILIFLLRFFFSRQPAYLGRSPMIDIANPGIESPYTTKTRSQRNLRHRQSSFVDQLFRKVQAPGARHSRRRRSKMFNEQAPQMA